MLTTTLVSMTSATTPPRHVFIAVFGPALLAVGLLGNALNIYVFTRAPLRGLNTFRFLLYLSVVDLLYLLLGFGHFLVFTLADYDFRLHSDFACAVHSFLVLFLSHLSSNVLAGVSVYRCVAVRSRKLVLGVNKMRLSQRSPATTAENRSRLRRRSLRTRVRAITGWADGIVLLLASAIALLDGHYLLWMRRTTASMVASTRHYDKSNSSSSSSSNFSVSSSNSSKWMGSGLATTTPTTTALTLQCNPSANRQPLYYAFITNAFVWIDLLLYCYVPFVIMVVCTVLIVYRLISVGGRSTTGTQSLSATTSPIAAANPAATVLSKHQQRELPIMPLVSETVGSKKSAVQHSNKISENLRRKSQQTYRLLVVLNALFFALVTPLVLANSFVALSEDSVAFQVVYLLAYANHCLNFLLYGLTSQRYRQILVSLVCRKQRSR